jgi:hypothetical protein
MTMSNNTNTETKAAPGKAPTHVAYHVREGKDKGFWTRVGAAWQHKDGKGFNVQLDVVPLDGSIQLRVATDKK